jgi:general nucleoside transport system permease protein
MPAALARDRFAPLVASLGAIALALLLGGLFLEARGNDAIAAYRVLVQRGLLNGDGLTETFKLMAPMLIVSAGLLVAVRAGVWNIGLDGQFLVGALVAGVVGAQLAGDVPRAMMLGIAAIGGLAGGAVWALGPALLRARFGLSEIITTLMMNFVAFNLTSWLVKGPVKDPARVAPETVQIPRDLRLPAIPGTDVHTGLLAGLAVVAIVAVLFRSTAPGFMWDLLGRNRRAAAHVGFPVGRLTLAAMLVSGAAAGLAGANDVLGVQGVFKANWNPGYGFTAFALVFLARLNALALVPFAFVFSLLIVGGASMPRRAGIPTAYVAMLEGLVLLVFAGMVAVERRRDARQALAAGEEAAA